MYTNKIQCTVQQLKQICKKRKKHRQQSNFFCYWFGPLTIAIDSVPKQILLWISFHSFLFQFQDVNVTMVCLYDSSEKPHFEPAAPVWPIMISHNFQYLQRICTVSICIKYLQCIYMYSSCRANHDQAQLYTLNWSVQHYFQSFHSYSDAALIF